MSPSPQEELQMEQELSFSPMLGRKGIGFDDKMDDDTPGSKPFLEDADELDSLPNAVSDENESRRGHESAAIILATELAAEITAAFDRAVLRLVSKSNKPCKPQTVEKGGKGGISFSLRRDSSPTNITDDDSQNKTGIKPLARLLSSSTRSGSPHSHAQIVAPSESSKPQQPDSDPREWFIQTVHNLVASSLKRHEDLEVQAAESLIAGVDRIRAPLLKSLERIASSCQGQILAEEGRIPLGRKTSRAMISRPAALMLDETAEMEERDPDLKVANAVAGSKWSTRANQEYVVEVAKPASRFKANHFASTFERAMYQVHKGLNIPEYSVDWDMLDRDSSITDRRQYRPQKSTDAVHKLRYLEKGRRDFVLFNSAMRTQKGVKQAVQAMSDSQKHVNERWDDEGESHGSPTNEQNDLEVPSGCGEQILKEIANFFPGPKLAEAAKARREHSRPSTASGIEKAMDDERVPLTSSEGIPPAGWPASQRGISVSRSRPASSAPRRPVSAPMESNLGPGQIPPSDKGAGFSHFVEKIRKHRPVAALRSFTETGEGRVGEMIKSGASITLAFTAVDRTRPASAPFRSSTKESASKLKDRKV